MKKTIFISLLVLCLVMVSALVFNYGFKSEKGRIYNDNEVIARQGDSYTYMNRVGASDSKKVELDFYGFSGSDTIWVLNFKKQTEIKFNYVSKISKGKFKAVLISPDGEVNKIFENTGNGGHSFIGPEGKYVFKLVGDNTNGKIKISLSDNEDVTVDLVKKN